MERIRLFDETKFIDSRDKEGMADAASKVLGGEVVAFPTETVYGLGANALDSEAVEKIFKAKGRPGDNPLIVHISDKSQIADLVSEITPVAQKLIDAFMPGPITVIMKKSDKIPANVTAGLDTVGIRMPIHKIANEFLALCKCPVAAPSANLSGSPSPTKASHVYDDMNGYVYAVIDGGDSEYGLESTVVDATGEKPVILRPGAVTEEMIGKVIGMDINTDSKLKDGETPKAPGMKYRHYAPKAAVEIIDLPSDTKLIGDDGIKPEEKIEEDGEIDEQKKRELFAMAGPFIMKAQQVIKDDPYARLGVYCGREVKMLFEMLKDEILISHTTFYVYGSTADVFSASHGLFDGLRTLDMQDVSVILAPGFGGAGLSVAYMNRLMKAAGKSGQSLDLITPSDRHEASVKDFDNACTVSVLFLSGNNKTLSIAAEGIFDALLKAKMPFALEDDRRCEAEVYCESAGFLAGDGEKPDPKMVAALQKIGVNIAHLVTRRASVYTYDANDLIITMRDDETTKVIESFPELSGRVFSLSAYLASKGLVFKDEKGRVASLSIPDPSGENDLTYEHTVKALEAWIKAIFPYVLKDLGVIRI